MLQKSHPIIPASDLQRRVVELGDILALPALLPDTAQAQRAFTTATGALAAAQAEFERVCKAYPSRPGYGPSPQAAAAEQGVKAAAAIREQARASITAARTKVDQAWLASVLPPLDRSGHVLQEICSLSHEAMDPLIALWSYASRNQLATPRLIAAAPAAQELIRQLTALVNSATAPSPVADETDVDD